MLSEMQMVSGKVRERHGPFAGAQSWTSSTELQPGIGENNPDRQQVNSLNLQMQVCLFLPATTNVLPSPLIQPYLLHPNPILTLYLLVLSLWTSTPCLQPSLLLTAHFIYLHMLFISLVSSSLAPSISLTPLLQPKLLLPYSAPCPSTPLSPFALPSLCIISTEGNLMAVIPTSSYHGT